MGSIIYEEFSYKLIDLCYKVDNKLGFGFPEKLYSDAFEELLKSNNIEYERELYCPIIINDKVIAKRYLDFLVDSKIVVELKTGDYQYKEVYAQLFQYLKINNLKLGLIVRFTKNGVQIKRVVNIKNEF